ncbi:GNAT family N-acetyltransferase [Evansella sp. AB-P1]|uniref:GNAT family N-acetyltransferase n=1 Tax=Evansella sp. AB-P1 TaxID=3037653 RepID=UPI0024202059|nr:GNAT family N-acetyltransferase [Evansella sp. AB-P1]MDG5787176.1 GNAT family N-acetyltransferase [Evansella sp. AB-P1]
MKPILLDIPTEIYSDRLLLRMPKPGDGKVVHAAIQASMKELKAWMPFAQSEQTEEEIEVNIREAHAKFILREDLRLLVFHKDNGEFIGSSGLHYIDWRIPKFEIGYWIDTRHSGKGYMTEAAHRIADFAFDELNAKRLEIICDEKNKKSRSIAEKIGFNLDVILKNEELSADGRELRNTCIYSKLT